ncbi:transposase family protein [Streptomyces sp. NPDC059862]|uniref:transposase family protein n=1 Tax=Streptomyces sp. NPDC059862 TaxID=3346975 RepID=UPI00364A0870
MVTCAATFDVFRHVVEFLARMPAAHRHRIGTPKGSRALGPFRQAVLVLRWFRERGCVHCLARDAGISQATGYRYLHEAIDVLDGMLIECNRVADVRDNGNDMWFSQKNKAFGGNVQFLAAPDGTPLWIFDVEPGSTPDITAARIHVPPRCTRPRQRACPRFQNSYSS